MSNTDSENAFDKLRLLAAFAVLFSHSFPLYRLDEPMIFGDSLGKFAVLVFFAISGYLVCQSWDRDPNIRRFFQRRLLRIFPGLIVAVLGTTFVIGVAASQLSGLSFWLNPQTWLYVINNVLLIASIETLPETFLNRPTSIFNGSLWTLRYEFVMYAVMAIAAAMISVRRACLLFFFAAVALLAWLQYNNVRSSTVPLPFVWKLGVQFDAVRLCKLGAAFFGAASLYVYRARVPLHWPLGVVSLLVCAALPSSTVQQVCLSLAVPYATVSLAVTPPKHLAGAIANDLSYGVYIYAYPVQQYISALSKAENLGWSAAFILSSGATLLLAWLSWRLVEKPALSHKPRAPKRAETRVV